MSEQQAIEQAGLPTEAEFSRLVAQANAGDAGNGEVARAARQSAGDLATGGRSGGERRAAANRNDFRREQIDGRGAGPRKVREMKAELISPATSVLEMMAVDRLVACWLQVQYVDNVVNKASGGTITNARYQLQRQTAADRRYTAAVKALADFAGCCPRPRAARPARRRQGRCGCLQAKRQTMRRRHRGAGHDVVP